MSATTNTLLAAAVFLVVAHSAVAGMPFSPANPADIAGEWEATSSFPLEYALLKIAPNGSGLLVVGKKVVYEIDSIRFRSQIPALQHDVLIDLRLASTEKQETIRMHGGFKLFSDALYLSLCLKGKYACQSKGVDLVFHEQHKLERARKEAKKVIEDLENEK